MISALADFDPATAAGLLARAALAVEDDGNPQAQAVLPDEMDIRRAILDELFQKLDLDPRDTSSAVVERVSDALDAELDSFVGGDTQQVLEQMAQRGAVPSDLFRLTISPDVQQLYQKKWHVQEKLILETIQDPDREQHFGESEEAGQPALVSLFAKFFPSPFPFRSFTLLVAGGRAGLNLDISQCWHVYADDVRLTGREDLIEVLRRFCDVFGLEFEANGRRTKFLLTQQASNSLNIHVPPVTGFDARGRKVEKEVKYTAVVVRVTAATGEAISSLAIVVNLDRYRASLEKHGWLN
ncbi:MAG TPA: hypothetical protein VEA40_23330 [Ramlibacter sp.]|nr:hypothetical protein [Ramlibacter sp.]